MKLDTPNQFSPITILLHWVVALTVISLIAIGVFMVETKTYSLYPWHKSVGFVIFFIVLLRVVWRIKNGWPTPVGQHSPLELSLAKAVHWMLILGCALMPISGILMSSLGGNGVEVFGLEVIARNPDPENTRRVLAHSEAFASFFLGMHQWLGKILFASIILHIAGGLKHHFIDKDRTLIRMLGKKS